MEGWAIISASCTALDTAPNAFPDTVEALGVAKGSEHPHSQAHHGSGAMLPMGAYHENMGRGLIDPSSAFREHAVAGLGYCRRTHLCCKAEHPPKGALVTERLDYGPI